MHVHTYIGLHRLWSHGWDGRGQGWIGYACFRRCVLCASARVMYALHREAYTRRRPIDENSCVCMFPLAMLASEGVLRTLRCTCCVYTKLKSIYATQIERSKLTCVDVWMCMYVGKIRYSEDIREGLETYPATVRLRQYGCSCRETTLASLSSKSERLRRTARRPYMCCICVPFLYRSQSFCGIFRASFLHMRLETRLIEEAFIEQITRKNPIKTKMMKPLFWGVCTFVTLLSKVEK